MEKDDVDQPPMSKRQQLAAELRGLRELSGLTGQQLAENVGINQPRVSRIESGRVVPKLPIVNKWADAVNASAAQREQLTDLVKAAHVEVNAFRNRLPERQNNQDEVARREESARLIHSFNPTAVPGLLQNAEYARRVFGMTYLPVDSAWIADSVNARMQRQSVLYDVDRQFEFVVTEAALRWRPGPIQVQLAQLDRIMSVSSASSVSIGVIPLNQEASAPQYHSFTCYSQDEGDPEMFVGVEAIHDNIIVTDPAHVAIYRDRWLALKDAAIFDDVTEFIKSLMAELQNQND
jgi:transcriptional regulator with XRE-family HTH domain